MLSCLLLMMFSLSAIASKDTMFPGPAQSPRGMDNTFLKFGAPGKLVWFGHKPIHAGFETYKTQSNERNKYCSDGKSTFACTHPSNFRAKDLLLEPLTAADFGGKVKDCGWQKTCTLNADDNRYKSYTVGSEGGKLILNEGVYYFDYLKLSYQSSLVINGEVEIHLNEFDSYGSVDINVNGQPRDLIFFHRNDKYYSSVGAVDKPNSGVGVTDQFSINNDTEIKAYIYSTGVVRISSNINVFGSVSARQLIINDSSEIRYAGEFYQETLDISPDTYSASACEKIPLSFTVKDASGEPIDGAVGYLDVTVASSNKEACWILPSDPNKVCHPISLDNVEMKGGKAELLLSGVGGSIDIVGTFKPLDGSGKLSGSAGPYSFSPSGYLVNDGKPVELIAGKTKTVSIKAVTSNGPGLCETENGIHGKINFNTKMNYERPNSGTRHAVLNGVEAGDGNNLTEIKFKKGVGEIDIDYLDAGHISVDLEAALSRKEDAGSQRRPVPGTPPEKGRVNIYARPYTLALCEAGTPLPDESEVGKSDKFIKAGQPFNVALKPIVWSRKHMIGPKISGSSVIPWRFEHCDNDWKSTPNFWKNDAPSASVALSPIALIAAPAGGENVTIGDYSKLNTEAIGGRYVFNGIVIGDVGKYNLYSKLLSTYLGMAVTPSEREIGRFYPSHFGLSSKINPGVEPGYDADKKGFTYLEQPFSGNYVIHAMTTDNKPVKNYHLFSGPQDKATFDDWVINPSAGYPYGGVDLTFRWEHPSLPSKAREQWQEGTGGVSEVSLDGGMEIQKANMPDGPFAPLRFAVGVVSPDRDGTQFTFCPNEIERDCNLKVIRPAKRPLPSIVGAEFGRGDFLFGRMRIEGFTETQNLKREQTLPVTVEVFNGSHFVTNERDNATNISTEAGVAQKDVLFSDTTVEADRAKIVLKNSANEVVQTKRVEKGTSVFQVIPPNQSKGPNREQFRFWQKLGAPTKSGLRQTWLQYRWQGDSFNEDPSAIGTFGFYRGSDRVIFKGEKNITLTGE
ncbi:DUF6701 domain-containing protein [Enterovibrio norvegicus]|uniref:DUF6701 domain-containing protein n=1 Tax=Enterovibrio norvegicus TaxID=188144 RepID=A0A2N7LCL5_9GAMM|nr:DUF6701 domain-containing protein [Enterovibrio norvegicus]PMN93067.1 hypothetical protein BCT23_03705 [Enterovibrio norvegicus]